MKASLDCCSSIRRRRRGKCSRGPPRHARDMCRVMRGHVEAGPRAARDQHYVDTYPEPAASRAWEWGRAKVEIRRWRAGRMRGARASSRLRVEWHDGGGDAVSAAPAWRAWHLVQGGWWCCRAGVAGEASTTTPRRDGACPNSLPKLGGQLLRHSIHGRLLSTRLHPISSHLPFCENHPQI